MSRFSSKRLAKKNYDHDSEFEAIHREEGRKAGTGVSSFGFNRDFYLNGTFEMEIWYGEIVIQDGAMTRIFHTYDGSSVAKLASSFSSLRT